MKNWKCVCGLVVLVLFGASCAPRYAWKSEPNVTAVRNDYFEARISPLYVLDGYKGFLLVVHNASSKALEIDWKKTQYIKNGVLNGGFLFAEMREGGMKEEFQKIAPDAMISKEIFPATLGYFSVIGEATIYNPMPPGENGALLVVRANGKELEERLAVKILQEKK